MAKKTAYTMLVRDVAYDLSADTPLPLDDMKLAELAETYNRMCIVAGTIEGFDPEGKKTAPVSKFKDKETGLKRTAALHSSLVAFAAGQAAEKNRRADAVAEKKARNGRDLTAPPEVPAEGGKRGREATAHLKVIHVIKPDAPRLTRRKAHYVEGMTVEAYVDAALAAGYTKGAALEHVNYDKRSDLISLSD